MIVSYNKRERQFWVARRPANLICGFIINPLSYTPLCAKPDYPIHNVNVFPSNNTILYQITYIFTSTTYRNLINLKIYDTLQINIIFLNCQKVKLFFNIGTLFFRINGRPQFLIRVPKAVHFIKNAKFDLWQFAVQHWAVFLLCNHY